MPHYLHQVAYSREGWEALLAHPQNRIEAVRPAIEKLGGKIETAWFAFGEYEMSPDEALQAFKKAAECGYRPASVTARAA
jgi:uncharacterized protein with GYD domain